MYYLKRTSNGIKVKDESDVIIKKGLKQTLNDLCVLNLSTYEGRTKSIREMFGFNHNYPVFVNNSMLFFPTESIRNYNCIYINYFKVLSIRQINQQICCVIFTDLSELRVQISHQKIMKQMDRCQIIINYLNNNENI